MTWMGEKFEDDMDGCALELSYGGPVSGKGKDLSQMTWMDG